MRASRLLVAVLALALLGLVPATSVASAARPASTSAAPGASPSSPAGSTSARRVSKLTAKVVKRNGKLFLTGVVRPRQGPVVIQRAATCNQKKNTCNFKDVAKRTITKKGRYTARIYAPRDGSWAWRARKDKTKSPVWVTCVKRPGARCPLP